MLEVGRFNLSEFLEPDSPHGAVHSSGHAAVASAIGGSVNHRGPHSELRTDFPLSSLFEVMLQHSLAGHEQADILCSSCLATRLEITAKEDL